MHQMWKTTLIFATLFSQLAQAFPARFGLSPDNSQSLLLDTIQSAQESLVINIYEFNNPLIVNALNKRIKAGIQVDILIEGEPLPKLSPEGQWALDEIRKIILESKNPKNRLFVMSKPANGQQRRYRYDHAKYIIADSARVLVSSENFTERGFPNPGEIGSRGWTIMLKNRVLAKQLTEIFAMDSDPSRDDVSGINGGRGNAPTIETKPMVQLETKGIPFPRPIPGIPVGSGEVEEATLITSPDSLKPLVELIRSAKHELDIEQMSFPLKWSEPVNEVYQSPLIHELIEAAKRGVRVRVLLNDENTFTPFPIAAWKKPNTITAKYLENRARCEKLPLSARIIGYQQAGLSYIHNKGILVDGKKALVSSINGTRNSVMNNREVAVLLQSPDAAAYYGKAFDFDWSYSPVLTDHKTSFPCQDSWIDWLRPFGLAYATAFN